MSFCKDSRIVFNTKTLEKIVHHPEKVLQNEEDFWENERPQKLTKIWAKNVNYEIPFEKIRKQLKEWADLSLEERKNHEFMQVTQEIIESKESFVGKAIPHLCSYLPKEADLNVTIHFTAFIPSRAFAQEDVVINVHAPYWNNNADNILNTIVHEIFHAGYSFCRDLRTEKKLENEMLYSMLDNFQSEGVCTYVGYKALPIYPAPDEKDYHMLEDLSEVTRLLSELNDVFSQVGKLSDNDLQKLAWDKCVLGRAYYVVGAHMCKVIEEEKGRDALIETLTTGLVTWVNVYNSLVKKDVRVQFCQ